MSAAGIEEIQKQVRIYILIGVALGVLTIVTVAASYLHLPVGQAVALAVVIATVKGSLVAGFFMHLISERQVIYAVLAICVVFFAVLMCLPIFTDVEMVSLPSRTAPIAQLESHGSGH